MNAQVLDKDMKIVNSEALPASFADINPHNVYLYVKAYMSNLRTSNAHTQSRSDVSGGGKKPWAQKGGGRARAGSITSPVFVGGGVAFGPKNKTNHFQKVNIKQKKLAFKGAFAEHAKNGTLFLMDSIQVTSGKTKDATAILAKLNKRDYLVVVSALDEKTDLAFRNLKNCFLIEASELNAYWLSAYRTVLMEKAVFEKLTKEG
ncbi:MAG: ribosomal protein [Pseudomonadota bacterium]|jgi:large subunit ribosomal protein L4